MHALPAAASPPALTRRALPTLRLSRISRFRPAAAVFVAILATCSAAWFADGRLTDMMLAQAAARAVDHVQLGVLDRVTLDDLDEPHTPAKLGDLATRMAPASDRMHQAGSGLLRINVVARDGMVLYSDDPANRGHLIPHTKQEFAQALNGQIGRDESNLTTPENADLGTRYHDALEVYVPVLRDGQVVGVYEIYQDAGPVRTMRFIIWAVAAAGVSLFLVGFVRRLARHAEPARTASPAEAHPGSWNGHGPSPSSEVSLTPRELDVLRLMTTSHTYRDIADGLVISEETVRSHVKSILRKLGQPDSARAIVAAVKAGILDLP